MLHFQQEAIVGAVAHRRANPTLKRAVDRLPLSTRLHGTRSARVNQQIVHHVHRQNTIAHVVYMQLLAPRDGGSDQCA